MGKRNNEVNGVLVYRRWCAGAIISAITLLIVIAVAVGTVAYNWLIIAATGKYGNEQIVLSGLDLIRYILKPNDFAAQSLINSIAADTTIKYFALIMRFSLYGMFGFMALVALFGVIEVFFFLFYVFTGRVVSPAAPVKIAWVVFTMSLIYAGLSFGLAFLISTAYAKADGGNLNFLQFLLGGIMPKPDGAHIVNFFWPLLYVGVAFIGGILISIVYFAAFKDKYYIGRAKRFGSGEVPGATYETNNVYNPAQPYIAYQGAPAGAAPQVIVVNGGQTPNQAGPIIATIPGQPTPVVVQAPAQNQESGQVETPAQPVTVLPADLKSIGGHAFSKNLDLKYADVPSGIKELGVGAFANCLNLEVVSLPKSVKRIRKNCFFNCARLTRINYEGSKTDWRYIVRGSNWLDKAGTKTVICSDGAIIVDPHR